MRRRAVALLATALSATLPFPAHSQVRASEHGMVAQTVDGTTITVEYYRPVARGRDSLFGGVVPWGHEWTPGANWATTLDVDKPVRLDGNPLPKGKYSVWMVPRPDSAWTVILSRDWRRFHTRPPDESDEQIRFAARSERGAHMEALSFYFPVVTPDGATLRMHWGTTFVPIRITVEPSRSAELPAEERGRYAGTYRLAGDKAARGHEFDGMQIVVTESTGRLRARSDRPIWGFDQAFDLLPFGEGEFRPSFYQGGKLFGMEGEVVFAFVGEGRHATGFDMRSPYGQPYARGRLVK